MNAHGPFTKISTASHSLDVSVHHLLVAGNVEMNRELVVFDLGYRAVAEFLVEDAGADGETAHLAHLLAPPRDRTAVDQQRATRRGCRLPERRRWRHLDGAAASGIPGCSRL